MATYFFFGKQAYRWEAFTHKSLGVGNINEVNKLWIWLLVITMRIHLFSTKSVINLLVLNIWWRWCFRNVDSKKKDEIKWNDHKKVCHLHIPRIDSNIRLIGLLDGQQGSLSNSKNITQILCNNLFKKYNVVQTYEFFYLL